jgi:hypothetical protein
MTRVLPTFIGRRALLASAVLLVTACVSAHPARRHAGRQQRGHAAISPVAARFGRGTPLRPPGFRRAVRFTRSDVLPSSYASGVALDGQPFDICYGWGVRPRQGRGGEGSTFQDSMACYEPWAHFQP